MTFRPDEKARLARMAEEVRTREFAVRFNATADPWGMKAWRNTPSGRRIMEICNSPESWPDWTVIALRFRRPSAAEAATIGYSAT